MGFRLFLHDADTGVYQICYYELEARGPAFVVNVGPLASMFRLSVDEWTSISSQFVMTSRTKRPKSALPFVFTEHGALMLASVLRSEVAIETSIKITRAFVAMRKTLLTLALAELQAKEPKQKPRRRIGFIQDEDK